MKKILYAILIVTLASCANSKPSSEAVAIQDLDNYFTQIFPADAPGAAVLVMKGDSIYYKKGFGLALVEPQKAVDPETFFCIASVSKQFSATALMILAQDGKLSLDDPASKYFPQCKADFFNRITLRHLMSHSSGIPDARPRDNHQFVYHSLDKESCGYLDTLSYLNFEPGTSYEYMNPTFQMMYMITEQASGMPFEQFMQERVFDKAGMKETLYFEEGRDIPHFSHGYEWNSEKACWEEYDCGEATFFPTKADGGIYTSVEEFALWEKALRNCSILNAESIKEAHSAHTPIPDIPYTSYGYGWFVEEKPNTPVKIYHTGDNGGYQIYAGRFPEKEILTLVFSTRNVDRDAYIQKIDSVLVKAGWL